MFIALQIIVICSKFFEGTFTILELPVIRPKITETTALGAAYLAGLAVGFWKNQDEISEHCGSERKFEPRMSENEVKILYKGWLKAVEKSKSEY